MPTAIRATYNQVSETANRLLLIYGDVLEVHGRRPCGSVLRTIGSKVLDTNDVSQE